MAERIRIKLVRSMAGKPERHRKILKSLGLTKMHKTVYLYDTPQIMGAVRKVQHLVEVTEAEKGGRSQAAAGRGERSGDET